MSEWLLANEPTVRLLAALTVFIVMALWEVRAPARALRVSRRQRWLHNVAVVMLNNLVVRLLVPMAAVGAAVWADENSVGLLNTIDVGLPASFLISVAFLDFAIWAQHLVFHRVPILWRLHAMHHVDVDYDVTLGTRFHPIEILLSMGIKLTLVVALGPPAVAVLVFELLLNLMAMFNHGNVWMPPALDAVLRVVVVTPDMHRVHHSAVPAETHANFGFNLSIWDRLFRTYIPQPTGGQREMTVGLPEHQDEVRQTLAWLLLFPFRKASS